VELFICRLKPILNEREVNIPLSPSFATEARGFYFSLGFAREASDFYLIPGLKAGAYRGAL
jgi:hypothetical protein